MGTKDVQIGSVFIHNVTYNDTGTYLCTFHRTLYLPLYEEHVVISKEVELTVVEKGEIHLRPFYKWHICISSCNLNIWMCYSPSKPWADGCDLWDHDVRVDRSSAAVDDWSADLLL